MINLHRVLFCTGIDLDDFMQIDCLAYKYLFSIAFHWLVTTFGSICVVCDYRGTPPPPNLHLSEIRISINDNYENNL